MHVAVTNLAAYVFYFIGLASTCITVILLLILRNISSRKKVKNGRLFDASYIRNWKKHQLGFSDDLLFGD
ncbi:hypothetical protein BpJC7_15450 [Weizmannia acidilactici]|uniref:Uncharacterized protein n=1 Tax=Weizmannia acidilactici TaxID=2607726 RepID=A0A5J4J5K1_9BACI|nr:hypothetical protein BpJC4_10080 [Weizmannia acidilactici]GER70242.1 hypothetical protein BpJC7_15450 [Weizmannia acidilactici]GER74557.1 hypothetical protein BpPP18_26240 [Weizmannia acidilactici]